MRAINLERGANIREGVAEGGRGGSVRGGRFRAGDKGEAATTGARTRRRYAPGIVN